MSRRWSWVLALMVLAVSVALMVLIGADDSAERSPVPVPKTAESARADALRSAFPGGDRVPTIVVTTRNDGARLSPDDLGAINQKWQAQVSADGQAAVAPVSLNAGLTGFKLNDEIKSLRQTSRDGLPSDLLTEVTGGPAFGADIANSFTGANITLLAVTAAVVALLLIATYRSPVLWLVPLAVIGFADRVAAVVGTAVASGLGMNPDGSTSGITSVLVFGAGTNYALLLISRYREELGRNTHQRDALTIAVRRAGPAILASNATVVLAAVFCVLGVLPLIVLTQVGIIVGLGILLDTFVVRTVIIPALFTLIGARTWWPAFRNDDYRSNGEVCAGRHRAREDCGTHPR